MVGRIPLGHKKSAKIGTLIFSAFFARARVKLFGIPGGDQDRSIFSSTAAMMN